MTPPDAGAPPRPAPRLDPRAVRETLRAANLRARHALSQNFLTDVAVLDQILAEAAPQPGDRVLEIGPGLGILTGALVDAGAAVTAVELDRGLVAWLRSTFAVALERAPVDGPAPHPAGSLALVEGDILDEDVAGLIDAPFSVVANLPYHITSPTLHRLLGLAVPPTKLVLMVQREVAQRIAAPPGAMSYLSVFAQYHASVRVAFTVPRAAFEPSPKVDSAVIVLEPFDPRGPGRLSAPDEAGLWRLVQAAFRERRKMLHNVLSRQLPLEPDAVQAALDACGIDGERRPQTLSVAEWRRLLEALGPIGEDQRGQKAPRA